MQTTIDFQQQRIRIKRKLGKTEQAVRAVLADNPSLRSIKKRNELIREVWRLYGEHVPCESITRVARKMQANGEFDTEDNQTHRANHETAYNHYFR
jgi:hypothetical protein